MPLHAPDNQPGTFGRFKLGGVKVEARQTNTDNPALIKLSALMPKQPIIPSFDAPRALGVKGGPPTRINGAWGV
jgi:hypothetical protein